MTVRKYQVVVDDEWGISHEIGEVIGTFEDASPVAGRMVDAWELETGQEAQMVTLLSLGKVEQEATK